MIAASVLEAMLKAGCSAEQIVAVVKADEDANAERLTRKREQSRIRQQNHRARNAMSRVTACDGALQKEPSPTPPEEKTTPLSPPKGGHIPPQEFADFWSLYPNKVGKPAAEAKFVKARKSTSLEAIMAGLRRYVAKTDDRPWCNPATWLNQQRWADEPASAGPAPPSLPEAERWPTRLAHARAKRLWPGEWGPMPGQPGCRVPEGLVSEGDGIGWSEWKDEAA